MKLELVPVPVTDVDRAKSFYADQLGFTVDVDISPAEGIRIVQLTPPGSACSIGLGTGLPAYEGRPGELAARGVDISPAEDLGGGVKYAAFADPDGNTLTLQEMPWRTGEAF